MRRSEKLTVLSGPAAPREVALPSALGTRRDLTVTFAFHCNFACTFCLVEEALGGAYQGVDLETFERLLADPRVRASTRRVLFSGGEVTLDKRLPDYIRAARRVPTIEHVRIQTNGARLAEPGVLDALVDAGLSEVFLSMHGARAETFDAITRRPGAFETVARALEAIAGADVKLFTNTVMVTQNHRELAAIVELLAPFRPVGMDFWGYLPRVDSDDSRRQLVPVGEVAPHLLDALDRCRALGVVPIVKHFPRCLLGRHGDVQDDAQPDSLVDDGFWKGYPDYACIHDGVCVHAGQEGCRGLSHAYVRRFGWEQRLLRPQRAADVRAAQASGASDYWSWSRQPTETSSNVPSPAPLPPDPLLASLALAVGSPLGGLTVTRITRAGETHQLVLATDAGDVGISIAPSRLDRKAYARAASYDVNHGPAPSGVERRVAAALDELARRLRGLPEIPDVSTESALETLLGAMPGAGAASAILRAVLEPVRSGALLPRLVEPSVALGDPALRLIVNVSEAFERRDPRAESTLRTLADALSLEPVGVDALVGLAREEEVFLGIALGARVRRKVYVRASPEVLARLRARLGIARIDEDDLADMLGLDLEGDAVSSVKRYVRSDERALKGSALSELLGDRVRGLPIHRSTRASMGGASIDRALHVHVASLNDASLGAAWSEFSSATTLPILTEARLAALHSRVRVLSETVGASNGRHVYLAGPSRGAPDTRGR